MILQVTYIVICPSKFTHDGTKGKGIINAPTRIIPSQAPLTQLYHLAFWWLTQRQGKNIRQYLQIILLKK